MHYILEFPNEAKTLAALIDSVPRDWAHVNGIFRPDIELTRQGKVINHTSFGIIHSHSFDKSDYPMFFSVEDVPFELAIGLNGNERKRKSTRLTPDLAKILLGDKLPSSLEFVNAGESNGEMGIAIELLKKAVEIGYKGKVTFGKYRDNRLFASKFWIFQEIANPNRNERLCELLGWSVSEGRMQFRDMLEEWEAMDRKAKQEGYKTEERLTIGYNEADGGKYEDILPLLNKAVDLEIPISKKEV